MKFNPFTDPVRVRLFAREGGRGVALRPTASLAEPAPAVRLNHRRPLDEQQIAEYLTSDDPERRRLALGALSDRMAVYHDVITGRRTVQLSSEALFPDGTTIGVPEAIMLSDVLRQRVDLRWTAVFNVQDRRMEAWPGYFKISDLYHAITVNQQLPGERIEIGFVEKGQTIFEHYLYTTGLGWNELEMMGRYERAEALATMQIRWANAQAQAAYTVLTASGLPTQSYVDDDSSGSVSLQNDIATINSALRAIRSALYNATAADGTGTHDAALEEVIPEDAAFYLLYNDLTQGYEDRISAALEVRYQVVQGGSAPEIKEVNRPVIPVGSPRIPTGKWYGYLGGRKNVASIHRDLRFYDYRDVRVAGIGTGEVGQGAYRMLRGDANQGIEISLS